MVGIKNLKSAKNVKTTHQKEHVQEKYKTVESKENKEDEYENKEFMLKDLMREDESMNKLLFSIDRSIMSKEKKR